MEIHDNDPRPGALVERFSWEMESRGRSDSDTDEFNQLRLDLIEQTKNKSREREMEIRRVEAHFSTTRPDDESLFNKTRQELLQSMKVFQALVPEELNSETTIIPKSWSDVEHAVSAVREKLDSKIKDSQAVRAKKWIRKMCNGLNDHSAALNMLPKDSEYVSLVGGAVVMIMKASANYASIAEAFARGIVDINDAVAIVQKNQVYSTPSLQQLTMRLYTRIFSYLSKFMAWYTERSRTRFLKSFNENLQQMFDEDLIQIKKISLLLSQEIQLYTSADVRVSKLLAEDTNWTVKYLVKLVENEKSQSKLREAANARMIQNMFLDQFKKSVGEIGESSKKMMAEYNERVRQEISGAAVTSLLTHRASQELTDKERMLASHGSPEVPRSPCRATKHDYESDIDSSSDLGEETMIQSPDIKFSSSHLEEYISWDNVFPFAETPPRLCTDTSFVARLDSFTTATESQILYAHAKYQPEGLNLLRSSAAKYVSLARENGISVVSYFCRLSPPCSVGGQPISRSPSAESTELTAVLYSIIRQIVDLLPAEPAAEIPPSIAHFVETRLSSLDGTPHTWDVALDVLHSLISCVCLPLVLFVIDGLNLLEDDFEHTTLDRVETLTKRLRDLATPGRTPGPLVKVLFTTSGLSGSLGRELDSTQVVACNASSPSREPPTRSWTSTLKLPKSTFPARVSPTDQAKYLRRCTDEFYDWQRQTRPANKPFVLHDGPPYANGELHVGHALNKVLKDIICRVQVSFGRRVDYVPGWDCHGLPIELKVLQQNKELAQLRSDGYAGAAALRKAARQLAENTVSAQMKEFRGWAVMADWERAWKTMDKSFEKKQLGVFREMVDRGLIYRRFKPVYWSPSSGTALAEAELEYKDDHISTAALVKFPLETVPAQLRDNPLVDVSNLSAVIWTTTPWTLPANAAIAVSDQLEYSVVNSETHGQLLIAKSRLDYLKESLKEELTVLVSSVPGHKLASETTYRPLFEGEGAKAQPFVAADYVTADSGSGLVHTAPGHGMDDYEVCRAHGIPAFAPVNNEGQFTDRAMPANPSLLAGKSVLREGNTAVLEYIEKENRLLSKHKYQHKYPYDWRSKLPIIIRATEQWFADVRDIRDDAIRALEDVRFIPNTGKGRLESFVKNRSEWCISRQRAWGVPIPALYHRGTGEAVLTKKSTSHIMKIIEERGIDAWWTDAEDDPAWIPSSLEPAFEYKRGTDTMDVWFDSGTSWTQMSSATSATRSPQADVYLEGTDQHRGWFQSGLLTYVAHEISAAKSGTPRAPFKTLVTHGFTLDHKSRKMSKSIGNVVHPNQIMDGTLLPPLKQKKEKGKKATPQSPVFDALGPDALRLWVASSDYTKDVVIGQQVLKSVNSSLHKYRVTFKLLLGALEDFDPEKQLGYEHMHTSDKIALLQLHELSSTCKNAFENYEFYKAVNAITKWANLEFSAFYVESIKDRLYAEHPLSPSRLAAQTTLYHIFYHLQVLLSSLTPILVEETWEHTPELIRWHDHIPLRRMMPSPRPEWMNESIKNDIPHLMAANAAIKTAQETARSKRLMGSSLQSFAHLSVPNPVFERYTKNQLRDLFVVSSLSIGGSEEGFVPDEVPKAEWSFSEQFELPDGQKGTAYVYAPQDSKCARCWRYVAANNSESEDPLCGRCVDAVEELSSGPADS